MPEATRAAALTAARRASADAGAPADAVAGGGTTRNTARFNAKRETILNAAALHFNARGLRGATLADIAADVGLVTTSITYYYRRKEALAVACFERALTVHLAAARQALQAGDGVAERVSAFLVAEAALPAAMAAGEIPPLIEFNDLRALPENTSEAVFGTYTALFRAVRSLLMAGPAPRLPESAAHRQALNAQAHLLLSVAHWLRPWLLRYEADDHPRVARRVIDLVLHGLAGAGCAWPGADDLARVPMPGIEDAVRSAREAARGWAFAAKASALANPTTGPQATRPGEAGKGAGTAPSPVEWDQVDEAFLRAATHLVNEQGYRGASVDRISARLQLTKGAFYHHHDTKLDLISACFDRSHALIRSTLRQAEAAHGDGWPRACAAAAALVRFQLSDAGPLLRASAITALPERDARDRVRQQGQRLNERLVGILADGLADGSVRPHDTALGAQLLANAMNAAAELHRWVPGIDMDNVTEAYVRPALLGLLGGPGPQDGRAPRA